MNNKEISSLLPSHLSLISSEKVCTLWAGYGSIQRLSVRPNDSSSSASTTATKLILKTVLPPLSPSTTKDEGNSRKIISYNVERYFYHNLSSRLLQPPQEQSDNGDSSYQRPVVAEYIPLGDSCDSKEEENKAEHSLLMSDLKQDFPFEPFDALDEAQTKCVLRWLASFHATFWQPDTLKLQDGKAPPPLRFIPPPTKVSNPAEATQGIWEQGGYWYLDTRSSEYESMLQDPDYEWLVPHSIQASNKLKSIATTFKTLLHGDPKAANILFNKQLNPREKRRARTIGGSLGIEQQEEAERGMECAMYDFQYVGVGVGAQDLVYFLCTSVGTSLLSKGEDVWLSYYFEHLEKVYTATHDGRSLEEYGYTIDVLKEHWELALVDWMRFMAGWGCWGSSGWVEKRAKEIIKNWEEGGN